jgi:peptidylprolyl isomerase
LPDYEIPCSAHAAGGPLLCPVMRRPLLTVPLCGALLAAALAGCGSSSKTASIPSANAPTSSSTATTTAASTSTGTSTSTTPSNPALAHKPTVVVPKGPAPAHLVTKDLIVGTGPVARAGQTATVQYVGVLYRNGKQFDASWDRGQPFTFPLGQGQVIPGWDQGIPGMRVGGRRELIIPASLAYGAQGSPPAIGPNEPLVFVVDLQSVSG